MELEILLARLQQWGHEHTLVSAALLISFLYIVKKLVTPKLRLPPNPPKLPIIGNLHQIGRVPYRSMKALSEKYGPLMTLYFGTTPTVVVSSPEVAQEIIRNHDVAFGDRLRNTAADALFYSGKDVAFAPYGEFWKQMKKISVTEILSQKRVLQFQYVREEETQKLVEKLKFASRKAEVVNFTDLFGTTANNIISRCTLGRVFENENGRKDSGAESVMEAVDLIGAFCFKDTIPMLGFLDHLTGLTSNLKKVSGRIDRFLEEVIDEHRRKLEEDDSVDAEKKDIVYLFLRLQKESELSINITGEELKAFLFDMFLAGTDTTATTMEWTMSQLMKNPSMLKRATEEVRGVMGKRSRIEDADFNEMPYLKCLVKETLRYYLSPLIIRNTTTNAKVSGYDIPAKTNVIINTWAIHRDNGGWEQPEVYNPERFLRSSVDFRGQDFQFVPFGAGRRICPGILFALKEVEFVLANLFYNFDFHLPDGASATDLNMNEVFTIAIRREVPLCAIPVFRDDLP